MTDNRTIAALCLAAALLLPGVVILRGDAPDPPAPQVEPAEAEPAESTSFRALLERWENLPPEKQMQLIEQFNRLKRIKPAERRQLMDNYRNYMALSPHEKALLQKRARQLARLTPEQRKTVQQAFRNWKQMPHDMQDRLRELWQTLKDYLPSDLNRLKKLAGAADEAQQKQKLMEQIVHKLRILDGLDEADRAELDAQGPRNRQRALNRLAAQQ